MVCPYASCLDCSISHSNGTHADLVGGGGGGGGGGGCSCMLLVQLTPTCTNAGTDLVLVVFSLHQLQLVQILHLHTL